MTKRIFEFKCENEHITEVFTESSTQRIECYVCSRPSHKIISAVRSRLEGITGAFPTAYDAWTRKHEEATRIARKRNEGATSE